MTIVKEEIVALIEELRIKQATAKKFIDHYTVFLKEPRCKKGIVEFLDELFSGSRDTSNNVSWSFDYNETMLRLTVGKSDANSRIVRSALDKSGIKTSGFEEIKNLRMEITGKLADYMLQIQEKLDASPLQDARERQLYLRRAVARLVNARCSHLLVALTVDQWAEVEPFEYIDYLTTDIKELTDRLRHDENYRWWSVNYDEQSLDSSTHLSSVITFLDYLDTFLVY